MKLYAILYNIFVLPLLWILFQIGGVVNKKIRLGIKGRENLFTNLSNNTKKIEGQIRFWFHASSLGEFEQAKPIIAYLKKYYPNVGIIVTFFSPSGFENSKNYKLADIVTYIPFDTKKNAATFLQIVKPTIAIMVRYDIWPNIIYTLQKKKIPAIIANATMSKNSLRKLPFIRQLHRDLYNCFTQILTVSDDDRNAFEDFALTNPIIKAIGDTRFDQVVIRSTDARQKNLFAQSIIENKKVFVVGQSWPEDDDVILPVLFKMHHVEPSLLTIVVPHEPTIEHLEELESKLEGNMSFIRFSEMNNYQNEKVILIDSIGVLVALYKYAHVVFVGGSFRQGIHNVLEPSIFGVPVIYGPKHTNSQEAVELAKRRGGFIVENEKELYRTLRTFFNNPSLRLEAGSIAETFVRENCGATERILQALRPYLT